MLVTSEYAGVTAYSGGIGTQYANLAPALVAQGAEVTVVTLGERRAASEQSGVRIEQVRPPAAPALTPLAWPLAAQRVLGKLRAVDAVVASEYSAGAALFAARKTAPLVTHLHGSLAHVVRTSNWPLPRRLLPQTLLQRSTERWQASCSDALIAPSAAMLESSRELWPRTTRLPSAVVPNTVDVASIEEQARAEPPSWFPRDGPVVMFSGRLERRKGTHVLGDAMAGVWRAHPQARFVIAGGGDNEWRGQPMSAYLRDRAGESSDRLHLVGEVPARELFPALSRASVVVLPSLWESFSLAALETMAVGRPVVATIGVFPDFVRANENSLLAAPGDSRGLGDLVNRLLAEPELGDRLGRGGTRTAAQHDVEIGAERFLQELATLTRAIA